MIRKSELSKLVVGKRFDEIEELPFEDIGQGYGFKSIEAFEEGEDYICYIPEYCYNEETMELDPDCCYTKADFMELVGGNEEKAWNLFKSVDWQHPSSLYNEMDMEEE